jgi:hypothetical protein
MVDEDVITALPGGPKTDCVPCDEGVPVGRKRALTLTSKPKPKPMSNPNPKRTQEASLWEHALLPSRGWACAYA